MGSLPEPTATSARPTPTTFPLLRSAEPDNRALAPFLVSTTRGFLPRMDPPETLPREFAVVEDLVTRMPVRTLAGDAGLLGQGGGSFGRAIRRELGDLTDELETYKDDLVVMTALFRDYSFLASAYLLEPCHERFVRGEEYGPGRQVLPRQLARPIARCAEM